MRMSVQLYTKNLHTQYASDVVLVENGYKPQLLVNLLRHLT